MELIFCLAFVGLLLVVAGAVAIMLRILYNASGYLRLVEHYRAISHPVGEIFTWRTVRIGVVRYRNAAEVVISPAGLYLQAGMPGVRHPAVLIPWEHLRDLGETRIYWRPAVEMAAGSPEIARIAVPLDIHSASLKYRKKT